LGNFALNAPNILGGRKGLKDENVVFKALSDFLRGSQDVTFQLSILLVSYDVEVLLFPSLINIGEVLLVLSFSLSLNDNLVDFLLAVLELKFEDLR